MGIGGIWATDNEHRCYFAIGFEVNDEREEHGGFVVNVVLVSGERVMLTVEETEQAAFDQLRAITERLGAFRV